MRNNTQVILFDTPGLVTNREMKKHQLESSFTSSSRHSVQHADLIGVVHDVSSSWTRNHLHSTVLEILRAYPTVPSFLILNKIDTLKSKRILLDLARNLSDNTLVPKGRRVKKVVKGTADAESTVEKVRSGGWPHFSEVFMVSSLTGDGLPGVMVN